MKKTHEKNINGRAFTVSEFPAMHGWRTFTKLSRGVLPALAAAAGSVKSWEQLEIDGDGLGKAAEYLVMELDEDKSEALIRALLEFTWVDGQEVMPQFDIVFQAQYGTLIKLLGFVIEVNYKSFLGENGVNIIKKKMPVQMEKD